MFFSQYVTPKIFFQNSGIVTFVPLWYTKTNERFPRYLKTDGRTNRLTRTNNYYEPHGVNPGPRMPFLFPFEDIKFRDLIVDVEICENQ